MSQVLPGTTAAVLALGGGVFPALPSQTVGLPLRALPRLATTVDVVMAAVAERVPPRPFAQRA